MSHCTIIWLIIWFQKWLVHWHILHSVIDNSNEIDRMTNTIMFLYLGKPSAKFAKDFHDRHTQIHQIGSYLLWLCNLHLCFWVPFILYLHFWPRLRTKRHNYTFNVFSKCLYVTFWGGGLVFGTFLYRLYYFFFLISWDYLFFLIHYFFFVRPRVRNVFVCLSEWYIFYVRVYSEFTKT